MRLIIVRHGETEENRHRIIQGHIPGKLSSKGKSQARKVALRLKSEQIDIIYCSDLTRAKDTVKEIKKYHPKTRIRYVKELREQSYGIFEGKREEALNNYRKEKRVKFIKTRPPGGESRLERNRRAQNFLKDTTRKHPDETVLWVTHGGIILAILGKLLGLKGKQYTAIIPRNTAVSMIEIDKERKHHVRLVNCVKHL